LTFSLVLSFASRQKKEHLPERSGFERRQQGRIKP
jgi:hypothetical protein